MQELINLDERLLRYWCRKAKLQNIDNQINRLELMRIATQSSKEQFEEVLEELQHKRDVIRINKEDHERHKDAWLELAALKGK